MFVTSSCRCAFSTPAARVCVYIEGVFKLATAGVYVLYRVFSLISTLR